MLISYCIILIRDCVYPAVDPHREIPSFDEFLERVIIKFFLKVFYCFCRVCEPWFDIILTANFLIMLFCHIIFLFCSFSVLLIPPNPLFQPLQLNLEVYHLLWFLIDLRMWLNYNQHVFLLHGFISQVWHSSFSCHFRFKFL